MFPLSPHPPSRLSGACVLGTGGETSVTSGLVSAPREESPGAPPGSHLQGTRYWSADESRKA